MEAYVAEAERCGLTTLAFTDHFPLSVAFDPVGYLSVPSEKLPLYEQAVLEARSAHPSLDILLGIELDYLGQDEDRDLETMGLDRFDLILGSVHFVDRWPFDDPSQRDRWDDRGQRMSSGAAMLSSGVRRQRMAPFPSISCPILTSQRNSTAIPRSLWSLSMSRWLKRLEREDG